MANLPEIPTYDAGVYQIETGDPVMGGPDGIDNKSARNLTNRTAYLKQHVDDLEAGRTVPTGVAPLDSPDFTGTPTAPDAPDGDNTGRIANTRFVQRAAAGVVTVDVSAGGNVTMNQALGVGVVILIGNPATAVNALFPTRGKWIVTNAATGSATVTVKTAAGTGVAVTQGKARPLYADGTNIQPGFSDFQDAPLTGRPTAPTPTAGDNSTRVATTAYVDGQPHGVQRITSSGNFTVPAGVYCFEVELWGGGSGSWASASGKPGGGGSGGGCSRKRFTTVAPGTVVPVTIGIGGAAGTPAAQPQPGGTSSFGVWLSATGGTVNPNASLANPTLGGLAGYGAGGDLNLYGGDGGHGMGNQAGLVFNVGGYGGEAPLSGGVMNSGTDGKSGHAPGGGGVGAGTGPDGTTVYSGGAGADGLCVVRW